ncbi:hypothetical protein ACSBR2_033762 [Camellia fascicularis]
MLMDVPRKVGEKAGFGGLFRDAKSSWILGYSGKLDVAIYRGTTIIHEKDWRNMVIEIDCQDAVKLINEGAHPNCPYRALVKDIKFLTSPYGLHYQTHFLRNQLVCRCPCSYGRKLGGRLEDLCRPLYFAKAHSNG